MRAAKIIFLSFAIVLAAGLVAPKFNVDRYRPRIRSSMENALGRKVAIGKVRFNLLTGPGFTVDDVIIEDDPALGAEPIAYVTRVEAIPRVWSLFSGHLVFSTLRLVDAQLNLSRADVRPGEYRWNFEPLLRPAIVTTFPNISLHGTRINFKAGNVKSMVYLLGTDLDIYPPASAKDQWHFRFEGQPARADRPARGSGSLRARGTWRPGALDLDLQLEKSELGDLIAVIRGEDIGVQGLVSGRARFQGPPARVAIEGKLRVEELHGWDQSIPKGESWPLELAGQWDVPGQQIDVRAKVAGDVLAVRYQVSQYLSQPKWSVAIDLSHFPVAPLPALARHLGAGLPEGLGATGQLDGSVVYSTSVSDRWQGQAKLQNTSVTVPGQAPVSIEQAMVTVAAGHVRLEPTPMTAESKVEADYEIATQTASLRFTSESMSISALGKQAIPVLDQMTGGSWSGELEYRAAPGIAPFWRGTAVVTGATVAFPAFAVPVALDSAEVHLEGAQVAMQRIRARAGGISVQGEYSYEPRAPRAHRFRFATARASTAELEKLLMPALRSHKGLLGITLPFGKQMPEWMDGFRCEGGLQIGILTAGATQLSGVRTRVLWDGPHVSLSGFSSHLEAGTATATIRVDLRRNGPFYEVASQLRGLPWKGGKLDSNGTVATSGTGDDLLKHLHAAGTFNGREVSEDVASITGRYDVSWPRMTLTGVRLATGEDLYTGQGSLLEDGTLLLVLTSGVRQGRLSGSITGDTPFHWLP